MTDQEFILCKWKRRLWPAKVLCKPGVAGSSPDATPKRMGFKAEILGLEKQVSVSSANVVPLTEERIKAIASTLEQKKTMSEAVEELQYRCSLKIALDILHETDSSSQMPPAEGPNPEFSREKSAPPAPSHGFLLRSRSKKSEHEAAKRKRKPQNNCGLKDDPKAYSQGGSVAPGRSGKAPGSGTSPARARGGGTNPARYGARDLSVAPAPDSHNCKKPEPKSSPRQKKIQPKMGNGVSCKSEAGRSQQGRKRCRDDSPQDQAQVAPEEGSPSVPSKSGAVEPSRKRGTQPGRAFLDSSCETASDELEKSISSESESLAKQLDGRREAEGGKHPEGAGVASGTDRKCRNHSGSSPGPSGAFPQPPEEENQDPSHLAGNKAPDSEEDEGLEPSGMSSRRVSSESLPPLSPLADEEEENFPSVLSHREPKFFEEGMLVWCKLRRYPYWPAVVKAVKRKHRRACVLFIDGTTNEKKKGFSVSLKSLKHLDCEEKQELIERAKENYSREIEWCLQLIQDYRIRVGCRSFTGSFLEYFAADISYPVRKEGYQSVVQMAFPNTGEEGAGESSSDTSPQKPPRKLLPDRTRAARDRENKKLVEFIVKTKGAEEHLLGILKSGKQSRWLKKFLNSSRYITCVETYLEDEEQLDLVVGYLKEVYREMDTKNLHQILGDGIRFISDVLLPEAIICAIAAVDDIDYEKAEEKYIKGPPVSKRERELFDEQVLGSKKLKTEAEPAES
ncbi:PWWP domain-containing DNA repair factor 3A [Haemorhous mexicanus]|uniref:PWWP domain-containing DNA repair factor 3A n=1 Tax=Haemorhous mexicanus TaxID=30427 RepID=UPI0028BF59FA|nr:PWWP domain-containing DNA repair factor 3A [Haemorhous mexicanus]XP_059725769.1 PWWP domain-containing DNA repair factor 3A [Haemorhous mexicanus]XP_059725770.1 PWWP domain-containing DNA repair factor 3A [Haemorhous mexicanus]